MEIPIFPLRTVLFPGMPLPLQIFEERYKVMTRELIDVGGVFGVVLIREGHEVGGGAIPYEVGTTAVIEEAQEVQGGRFVLTARGQQRFRLRRMLPPQPYPFGEVELLADAEPEGDGPAAAIVERVHAAFPGYFHLALSLTDQWARGMRLPRRPHELVNFLAPWLQAEETEKQRLLEIESPVLRLEMLSDLLQRLLQKTEIEAIEHRRRKYEGFGAGN
ncbi:MAG: LON peptidase substrate-binding domain-containing protein [Dehalococcoidia bacterium]|nr:LON peptidase substrate-binding domain-containing protein [Dehalococcoidia bacterium]